MAHILHMLVRYMVAQLQQIETYDNVYGLCFVSETEDGTLQIERYSYVDEQAIDPQIVSPTDTLGTYIYIRELDDTIDGEPYENYEDSSCGVTGATVRKRLKAVVVSDKLCYPVELSTTLVFNISDIDFSGFNDYPRVEDVRIEYVAERIGIKKLYEIETGHKPKSDTIQMASFEFDITFDHPTSCSEDALPNLC